MNSNFDTDAPQLLWDLVAHFISRSHRIRNFNLLTLFHRILFFSPPHTGLKAKKAAWSSERTPVLIAANGQAHHTNTTTTVHLFFYAYEETTVNSFAR